MKIRTLLILSALLLATGAAAQDKMLSIEDCYNSAYQVKGLKAVQWIPGSAKFSQVKGTDLIGTDPYSNREDTIVSLAVLNKACVDAAREAGAIEPGMMKGFPAVNWKDENTFWFFNGNQIYTYHINSGSALLKRSIAKAPEAVEVAPVTLNVAAVDSGNVMVYTAGMKRQITFDGGNGIVYGQAVHRNEFGINGGLFWNTDGSKLAFYRMDERRVTQYPLIHIDTRPANETEIRYPMAGDSSHTVTVGVYNCLTDEVVYLKTDGAYDQYLTNITWSPDGSYIYIAWVNREQNHMQLRRYNSHNGMMEKVLVEEKHDKYVEPENGPIFIPGSNNSFICFSERSGFDHLYLYENGKTVRALTSGNWEVTRVIGFDKSGDVLYIETTRESPLERHAYALRWKDKDPVLRKLTTGAGTHFVMVNNHSNMFMDVMTSRKEPRKYTIYKTDGSKVLEVYKAPNPVADFKLGDIKIEPYLVNGTALYTRTFLPPDFDPSQGKKYPVVVYVYGGPHAQMITESWLGGANLWFHYMAQNGYIVFTVDGRGSAHRGLNFENATFRQLGTLEMDDQLGALEYLKRQPWVDSNRLGVHGWSFGGFMTTSLMTRHPGAFKVGVAGGPVIDWKYYEIMYTERYMDRPQENPEGYKTANLLNYADKLEGRLLMIHGTDDDVVVWQHSLMYVQEMVKRMNANLDYYVYPGHKHNVLGPDRAHLYKKISQYFFDFL